MNIADLDVNRDIKIVFMGTPSFAVPVLLGLLENYKVKAVVTQPDKPVGRKGVITYSPIKQVALDHTILALQPKNIKKKSGKILFRFILI